MSQAPDDPGDGEEEQDPTEGEPPTTSPNESVNSLHIDAAVDRLGPNRGANAAVEIADVAITGITQLTIEGEGFESQYLREVSAGDGADADPPGMGESEWRNDQPLEGGDARLGSIAGGEAPPITIIVNGVCGHHAGSQLADLRDATTTFDVRVLDETFGDMELVNFDRSLTGDQPYTYEIEAEVREWREYEVNDITGSGDNAEQDSDNTDAPDSPLPWEEDGGETGDPAEEDVGDDDQTNAVDDNDSVRNVLYTEDGDGSATLEADGTNFDIADIGFTGESDTPRLTASVPETSRGSADGVYFGEGTSEGPVVLVDEDNHEGDLDLSRLNVQDGADGGVQATQPNSGGVTLRDSYIAGSEIGVRIGRETDSEGQPSSDDTTIADGGVLVPDGGGVETIQASNEWYWLSDGEVFENKIIDYSNGNWFGIYGRDATNWTVRNVAFVGTHTHDRHAFSVSDAAGGTSRIENVYLADGCVRPSSYSSHGQCAIFVAPEHSGHIDIVGCNIQDWPNNGIYASSPGYTGSGGTVHIDDCYAANNYVSCYRIASDGDQVTNCVAVNDGGRYNGRLLWGWYPGPMSVENCDFAGTSSYASGNTIFLGRGGQSSTLNLSNTQYDGSIQTRGSATVNESGTGSNPDTSIPSSVPTSPEDAAGGSYSPPDDGGGTDPGDGGDGDDEPANDPNDGGAEYDVIELDEGEHRRIEVNSGEVLADVRIDQSADNCAASILAGGDGWAIRNVSFVGEADLPNSGPCVAIRAAATSGGTGRIEDVYLADGSTVGSGGCSGSRSDIGRGGIHLPDAHEGEIVVQQANVSNWRAYGIDARDAPGELTVLDCYFKDNGHADVAVSGSGTLVDDCVFVHESEDTDSYGVRVYDVDSAADNTIHECDFVWNVSGTAIDTSGSPTGAVTVIDCATDGADTNAGDGTIDVVDGFGSNPSATMPAGTPAAPTGGDEPHTIENVTITNCEVGVLAEHGLVRVVDCEIDADEPFQTANGGEIETVNTNTGSDADTSVPWQVPTSAGEAANGTTTGPQFTGD